MKTIRNLILFVAALTLAACGDDDATYTPTPVLGITASDVLFEPDGGTGSITTNSTGTLQAVTESSWLSLQVQGNRVTVDVSQNPSLHGRSAKVSLSADGRETSIVVTQKGMVFDVETKNFVIDSNAATELQLNVRHMMAVTTEASDDWLTPVFDDETNRLSIALSTNTTGTIRSGSVTVRSGEASELIRVTQYDLTEDIYGYYSFDYRTKEGKPESMLAIVQGGEMEIIFTATTSFYVPLAIDDEAHTLTAQAPSYVGRYAGSYYTYLLVGHENVGSPTDQSTSQEVTSPATLQAVEDEDGQWQLVTDVFGGSWDRYNKDGELLSSPTVDMWIFDLYTGRVNSDADWSDLHADYVLMKCCRPHLTKLTNAEGEAWLADFE